MEVVIPRSEYWDADKEEFVYTKGQVIKIEHSLLSISKWESKWKRPFLDPNHNLNEEEMLSYIQCMTITQNVDPAIYKFIPHSERKKIADYIQDNQSAHKIVEKKGGAKKTIESERIYFWMSAYGIPFSCEKWHISRLFALLDIAAEENKPKKNMPKGDIYRENAKLNAARRKALGTKG